MNINRRQFNRLGLILSSAGLLISSGVLKMRQAWATRPDAAFQAETLPQAMQSLFGDAEIIDSEDVVLNMADIAEDGSVVPVKVTYAPEGLESVYLIADKNPVPLLASFDFGPGARGYVATRVKLAETGPVQAIVKAKGQYFRTSKQVEVTAGGCG